MGAVGQSSWDLLGTCVFFSYAYPQGNRQAGHKAGNLVLLPSVFPTPTKKFWKVAAKSPASAVGLTYHSSWSPTGGMP